MKLFYFLVTITFIAFCCIMLLSSNEAILKNQEITLNKLDSIHQSDTAYIQQITLFREHYNTCSFIARDDIKIGYDNYLQYRPEVIPIIAKK